jgi:hypothetical protein
MAPAKASAKRSGLVRVKKFTGWKARSIERIRGRLFDARLGAELPQPRLEAFRA